MQLKIVLISVVLGIAAAQRGHYAGNGYIRNEQAAQAQPAQSNFVAPSGGGGSQTGNRIDGPVVGSGYDGIVAPVYQQQQPGGFGQGFGPGYGFGFPNQGFPFSPFGFNGR